MAQNLAPAKKIAEIYLPYLPLFASLKSVLAVKSSSVSDMKSRSLFTYGLFFQCPFSQKTIKNGTP